MTTRGCFPVPPSQGPEITAEFNFINGDDFTSIKPYFYGGDLPSDKEYLRSNITYKPVADIGVVDIGGCKDEFNLEQHGLEFLEPTDLLRALPGTEDELKRYLTNLAEWLRDVLQAERAIVYDYAFRKSLIRPDESETAQHGTLVEETVQPATIPHIDHTKENGFRRALRHFTDAERRKYVDEEYRVRVLNIWRPITPIVRNWPLAFCDPATIRLKDLVRVDRLRPTYAGEVYYLQHAPEHRWYYLRNHTPDDIAVFSGYDTHPTHKRLSFGVPHASFEIKQGNTECGESRRESLEIRVILISPRS